MKYITIAEAAEKAMTDGQPEKHDNRRRLGIILFDEVTNNFKVRTVCHNKKTTTIGTLCP